MPAFTDLFAALDADPRVRGRQFEHICRWYLENDPQYRSALRQVWLWDDWPGRWSADAGIDLVAEDQAGRLWAIQAKAYDPKYTVTKADVDTFLAESSRAAFAYRMLIATTDRLSPNGRRTIDAQEKAIGIVGLSDLLTADVNWPANPARLRPSPPPKPAKPRGYQREAIRAAVIGFDTADRGQMIMACGTGKTLTAQFIAAELDAQRTLVLVPSLSLLKQTMRVWQSQGRPGVEALPVCSDETVSRIEDIPVEHVSELGLPVTTDPGEIAAFLRKRAAPRVVFSTYQSSPRIAEAFALGRVPAFDLIVADEAHRCAGPQSSNFSAVLDGDRIRAHRRLFMTATPRYFTGRVVKAAGDEDLEVASMDDETTFGLVFHRLGFSEAISRKLLTDYQVAIVGVDDATYRAYTDKGTLVTRDGEVITDARSLAGQIGLAKAMRKYDLRRVISFHSRVARAQRFATEMPDVVGWMPARQRPAGGLWSRYASGAMTAGERHVLLQRLRRLDDGERGLLANARCLAEGVDVPTLDGVAFIDPRRSEVDIVQAVGRAIRKADDKTVGTIVIPVFIDTEADPEAALDDSVFKPVWDVIKALRAHDGDLAEQIDTLRREMGRRGGAPRLPDKIHLDVPVHVGQEFVHAFDARLVEQTSAPWEFWFGLLQRYADEHGTALVLQSYVTEGGDRLGSWVTIQRSLRSKGRLSPVRQELLEALPGWSWVPKADQWEDGIQHLREYVDVHGTAGIRDDYVCDDGYRLGKWVGKQRTNWTNLPADRQHRLQRLPGWTLDARSALWETSLTALTRFAAENGHASPPRGLLVDGIDVESWVRRQRRTWDQLSEERQQRLQALPGWTLNMLDDKWDTGYRHLVECVESTGSAQVLQSHVTDDGYRLGKWVSVQRRTWDKLSEDRRQRLAQLPGWTLDARGDWWEDWFRRLGEYVAEHGDARVPQQYVSPDGTKLGLWVANQKSTWASMRDDRRRRLEQLPGWTLDSRTAFWEEGFRHLSEYTKEHGSAQPPSNYIREGFKLRTWVNTQRQNWATLDDDRRRRLEQLPGWTANTKVTLWEEGFEHLTAYVEENGTALVPAEYIFRGFRLGQWVAVQRSGWSKLRDDRRQRLAALPGWAVSARDAWWEEGFGHLATYVDETDHASPPQKYITESGFNLGSWVATQRQSYAKGKLSEDRKKRLVALRGWEWQSRFGPRA
ncbi:DEAD/DEAH box helicase [[Mycobacterium] zoologicum]|uniref:DEAD/DEAH box helicase n=1 Tax=[Mycobacterium] zoologicum TaxID=2872311 RepID=UPI001CDB18C4|nr:DEAD/DEAH box helicase [Mycolicibacter sp. MYC101]MEB3064777.1 Helicase associated domain protein [Mycolicibacter sp. MYC101]